MLRKKRKGKQNTRRTAPGEAVHQADAKADEEADEEADEVEHEVANEADYEVEHEHGLAKSDTRLPVCDAFHMRR